MKEFDKKSDPEDYFYIRCPNSVLKITFMTIHPDSYYNKTNRVLKICIPCCRFKDSKPKDRIFINGICKKYGFIPEDAYMLTLLREQNNDTTDHN